MATRTGYRRSRKLIKPGLQLKVVFTFVLVAAITCMMQAMFLTRALSTLASRAGDEQMRLMAQVSGLVKEHLVLGFVFLVPLFLVIGVLVTFRIAGPIHRIEKYLREVADGRYSGPCVIRKDDELQELCDVLNQAIDALRTPDAEEREVVAGDPDSLPAALPTDSDSSTPAA